MKRILYIFFFILTSFVSKAQCDDTDKLKFGGSFGTRYGCYEPKSSTLNFFSYDMDTTLYCCHISKIQKYANFIESISEKYIKQRAGKAFYDKLVFQQIMVIYHDYLKIENFDSLKFELDKCGRITYWITFSYFADSTIEYGFGIEYDSKGNMVNDHKIPSIENNQNFTSIIELCEALEIVKTQSVVEFDSIKSIELNYDNEINSFVWLVKEDYPDTEGMHDPYVLYINANSGELYKTEKEYWSITY